MIEKYAPGCFRLKSREVAVEDFADLREEAEKTRLRRARICVHQDTTDPIQEMFVGMMSDSFKGEYKYLKPASMLLLSGKLDYYFGDEVIHLRVGRPFIRIEAGVYHRPVILSEYVLLHETHLGPWEGPIERQMR